MKRVLVLLLACYAWISSAATFTVTNGNNAGAGSLRQAIIDANADGVADIININAGLTITPTSGEMAITTPVTINGGANVTIDGSGNGRPVFVFSTNSDTWLVDNITFSGFSSSGLTGGVIRTQGGALWTLTIQNCTFDNNDNVTNWGGAIGTENGNRWTLNIDNCTFTDNRTLTNGRDGGAVFLKSTSGTQLRGIANITNCTFSNNEARDRGGAIYNDRATLNMSDCIFTSNTCGTAGQGGAYAPEQDRLPTNNRDNIQNCQFIGNTARRGAAVRLHNQYYGDFTNCVFTGNICNEGNGGGAVNYQHQETGTLVTDVVFTDCTFANNSSIIAGGATGGGAIRFQAGAMTLRGCVFSGNTCPLEEGGAIAQDDNGAAFDRGNLLIEDCRFINNSAELGGAIFQYAGGCQMTIRDTTFETNSTTLGSNGDGGGAIQAGSSATTPSFLTIEDSTFTQNTAERSGGAMFLKATGYRISGTTFSGNHAGANPAVSNFTGGGAIRFQDLNSAAVFDGWREIEDCTFTGNLARNVSAGEHKCENAADGGALYINNHLVNIRRTSFINNEGDDQGGGLVLYNDTDNILLLEDCTFTGNRAEEGPGANLKRLATVSRCTFDSNVTWLDADPEVDGGQNFAVGGAIFMDNNNADVTVSNSTFTGNQAQDRGGAFAHNSNGTLKIYNSTIVSNSVLSNNAGGAIRTPGGADNGLRTIEIYSTIIADNTDANGGGDEDIEGQMDVFENNLIRDVSGFWIGANMATPASISGTNVQNTDPQLGPLQNNGGLTSTMEPSQVSPVIDVGSNVLALTSDQRGSLFPRNIDHAATGGAGPDIGAFELAADDILDFTVGASPNITLRLSSSGNSYEIVSDASGTVIASQTTSSTNSLDINGSGVGNTLTIDFSNGDPLTAAGGTDWDGGADVTSDGINVTGGTHAVVTYTATSVTDGTIDYDGSTISYQGLEPIVDNGSASTRIFTTAALGSETITVSSPSAGNTTVAGPAFENVTFANPTTSLTIDTGGGTDVINTDRAAASNLFGITVNFTAADAADDTINFDAQNGWAIDSNPGGDTGTISGHLFTINYSSFSTKNVNNVDATLVPTLTQWGIIILFLLIGSVGMIQIARQNGATNLPLDLSSLRLWAGRCAVGLLAFWTGCILVLGHIPLSDLIGGAICLPVLAYFLHLIPLLTPQLARDHQR